MNGSLVRATAGASRTWRMRQWPNDPTVAHLIFTDHQKVPTADELAEAVEHARRRGARAVRTSALFPDAADIVLADGFQPIDHLALLQHPLGVLDDLDEPRHDVRPLRMWRYPAAATLDRVAFGPMWGNDTASLRDIRRATPTHRSTAVAPDRDLLGFAVSGAAGDNGYLQRIAVDPAAQRTGVATSLVLDALRWMVTTGRRRCLVNTGVDNAPALALYDQLGFQRLPDQLTIAEHRFG